MKSFQGAGLHSVGLPLAADDFIEIHAARLLLLLNVCGTRDRIVGLTKLAKLDFFARYPRFFTEVCTLLDTPSEEFQDITDATMVRFHYGPWDRRYYQVLAYLEARQLITVDKAGDAFIFALTELGKAKANSLVGHEAFLQTVLHMRQVKRVLGSRSGSSLKSLIYSVFDKEIAQKKLGQVIEP